MHPPKNELHTWAAIAEHLDVSVRTAQTWEDELGLPIKRITEGSKARVLALVEELDDWKVRRMEQSSVLHPATEMHAPDSAPEKVEEAVLDDAPQPPRGQAPRPPRRFGLGLTSCVVGILALLGLFVVVQIEGRRLTHVEPIARVTLAGRSVQAIDGDGHTVWSHSFTQPFAPEAISYTKRSLVDFVRIADLRGDGEQEVLVVAPFRSGPNSNDPAKIKLVCFSGKGEVLWSFEPSATFQFGEHVLGDPWNILDVLVSKEKQHRSIWVAAGHSVWGNSIVFQVDPANGRGIARFVNTGQLITLNEQQSAGKTFLLAGGFNNEYETGILAVLDESKPFAASPQTSSTRHKCVSCPPGGPEYYFVVPHSELNALAHDWLDGINYISFLGEDIDLSKHEIDRNFSAVTRYLLRLEPRAHLVSLRYGSDYDIEHRKLERAGTIKHALADCPERLHHAPIRMWNEAAGWSELPVKPASQGQ